MNVAQRAKYRSYYSWAISLAGVLLAIWGLIRIPTYENPLNFFLLILLAAISEIAATYVKIKSINLAYEVGTAISMAAIPLFGPEAAATAVAFSSLAFWFFSNRENLKAFKKNRRVEQVLFNIGMHSVSIFVAGYVFLSLEALLSPIPFLAYTLPWLPSAIIYDQVNLWMVILMMSLAIPNPPKPLDFWRENRWAMVINIAVLTVGGLLLTFAVQSFGWIGIVIFFIPIVLSSFSFSLYVRQMEAHMNNLENIIAERTDELQGLMKEKDAFLAVLTHDMKSPLTSIGIYAALLKDRPGLLQERPHITDTLMHSQETLLNIVNDILDLEKLQSSGSMQLEKERFDLVLTLEAVVESLRAQAQQKEITLEYCPQIKTIPIMADRHQIERVVQNLVSNGVKYSPQKAHVQVSVTAEEQTAVIQVTDNGYGIPEDELPYVFDRYRRVTKHKKVAAGTGLGLAITKALVEAHDGQISVTSEEQQGSQFTVTLPF